MEREGRVMHTKRSKHDKGEGVANDPFANATKDHQKTAEEEEYTFCTRLVQTPPYVYTVSTHRLKQLRCLQHPSIRSNRQREASS